jgi:hypothetical protein
MIIHHKLFSVVARTCIQFDIQRIMYYIKRQQKQMTMSDFCSYEL